MIEDKKAQFRMPNLYLMVAVIIISLVVAIVLAFKFFQMINIWTVTGLILIIGGIFFLAPTYMQKGGVNKNKMAFLIIIIFSGIVLILIPNMGLIQQTAYMDGYFESPFFATIACLPEAGSISTSGTKLGIVGENVITCPINTPNCDVLIDIPAYTSGFAEKRKIQFWKCDKGNVNCDSKQWYPESNNLYFETTGERGAPACQNLPENRECHVKYVKCGLTCSIFTGDWATVDQAISFRLEYPKYTLQVINALGGGWNVINGVDCKMPQYGDTIYEKILSSTVKSSSGVEADTTAIVLNNYLRPNEKYNYIAGTVTRAMLGNAITYNGQPAFCQDNVQGSDKAAIYKIGTIETLTHKYNIVDKNTLLATVDCCNEGSIQLNRICRNYKWETVQVDANGNTNVACSITKPCPDGRLPIGTGTNSFAYQCNNGQCVVTDIRAEECNGAEDCGTNKACVNFKCVATSTIPDATSPKGNESNLQCQWYQKYVAKQIVHKSWYNYIGIGDPTVTTEPQCEVWIGPYIILGIFGGIVIIILVLLYKPKKSKRR